MSLEFGVLMALIGAASTFGSLAVIAIVCIALKRFLKPEPSAEAEMPSQARFETPAEEPSEEAGVFKIGIGGKAYSVKIEDAGSLGKDTGKIRLPQEIGSEAKVVVDGEEFTVKVEGAEVKTTQAAAKPVKIAKPAEAANAIRAPMRGSVVKVNVKAGDRVEKGSVVLVLEAMKMENTIETPFSGVVEDVRVSEGDAVEGEDILIIIR